MRLSVVIPLLGQREMVEKAVSLIQKNVVLDTTEIILIDQGNTLEGSVWVSSPDRPAARIYHTENVGVYPTFKLGFEQAKGDVVAFFHSDLMVNEAGFDARLVHRFANNPKLGMIGFVGSSEIDDRGGRGGGTTSNFLGYTYDNRWTGSPAEAHGKRNVGYTKAAVVDGCAMVIRRKAWEMIGYREDFPPHHFYDRLISTQLIERRWEIEVAGVGCDHISGQTVGGQPYTDFAERWSRAHLPESAWVGHPGNYSWDQTVYQEAERQWLTEYRNNKHLIPIKV